ncbi:MAG: SpoIIE family protein phosphatase [Planctomycetaceae bacterium]|nr:SpoIIE family protein phosphatase [Planctomycetaceae bacterium]
MAGKGTPAPLLLTLDHEGSGRPFRLDREVTIIGRSPACDVVLGQDARVVSSRHARIIRRGDGYCLEDLGSLNGTRVEGKPVTGTVLLHDGDRIEICDHKLLFDMPMVAITEGNDSTILGTLATSMPDPGVAPAAGPEQKLHHILEISRNLGDALGLGEVLDRTLETLFAIFPPADRGFVLLNPDQSTLVPDAIRTRHDDPRNLTICRTVLEKVMNEGQAILSTDMACDERFAQSISLVQSEVRTMMCVPLLGREQRPIGILQIDARDDRVRFNQADLDLLVAVAAQVGLAVENARLHENRIELIKTRQEAQDAAAVQKAFLPQSRPQLAGYEFWDCYEPAGFVGGDYFDYLPLHLADDTDGEPPRRLLVALGDVVGKGMPAALMMARLSAAVRLVAFAGLDPVRIMEHLNLEHYEAGVAERFATCLLVQIDAPAQRLTIVTAGHMGPIILRRGEGIEIVGPEQGGMPLGVTEEMNYRSVGASIAPGDVVVLYTDGVTDAMNPKGKPFGDKRLRQVILGAPGGPSQVGAAILRAVRKHISGAPQADDLTLLCFGPTSPP